MLRTQEMMKAEAEGPETPQVISVSPLPRPAREAGLVLLDGSPEEGTTYRFVAWRSRLKRS